MINKLIEQIVECLEEVNEERVQVGRKTLINIPLNIVTLEQYLGDSKYLELHKAIEEYKFEVYFKENKEEYYSEGDIIISLYKEGDYEYYGQSYINEEYIISLNTDLRDWGYCQCEETDNDYDARYKCCGHGCKWAAPAFSVTKSVSLGSSSFSGDEHDFWNYQDKYNNITEIDKKEEERLAKISYLRKQQEQIIKQLVELER